MKIRGRRAITLRVLVTTPLLTKPGGVAQYLRVVRPHLQGDVEYFTIGARSDHECARQSLVRLLKDCGLFARAMKRGEYEIVHLNPSLGFKALIRDGVLLLIAKIFGKTVLVFNHGWDDKCEQLIHKHFRRLFRSVYGRADAFIVLGSEFKERLRRAGYEKAVFVQAAPVADELLADVRRKPIRDCATVEHGRFNILFLARIEKAKGIYEALDAYALLKTSRPSASLTVAGDGWDLGSAKRYADSRMLADVFFLGHVEGSAKFASFRSADAYLFPSYTEGLPISVLEAMAYGLPVVTCAVGGLCDFFEDNRMGFITQSHDPLVLAALLGRLLDEPALRRRIGLFNRRYAAKHFAAPRIAAGLQNVYQFLAGSAH
jgi:glycosyltransferase involved in cell wall biosynthesis